MWDLEKLLPALLMYNRTAILENTSTSVKINIRVLYSSAIPLLGIYPREIKICVQTKTYTQVFILLYVAPNWKQMFFNR
jgi:hypothetical protein